MTTEAEIQENEADKMANEAGILKNEAENFPSEAEKIKNGLFPSAQFGSKSLAIFIAGVGQGINGKNVFG